MHLIANLSSDFKTGSQVVQVGQELADSQGDILASVPSASIWVSGIPGPCASAPGDEVLETEPRVYRMLGWLSTNGAPSVGCVLWALNSHLHLVAPCGQHSSCVPDVLSWGLRSPIPLFTR